MRAIQSVPHEAFRRSSRGTNSEPLEAGRLFVSGSRDSADKQAAILWVRMQMVRNSISFDDLMHAGCFEDAAKPQAVRYRSADGRVWDGKGELPDWLQRAVNAGQSIEHFRVK
ncbi:H-NS family nucleoid-associated regulatory protein [Cupriavidus sp. YAF13]